MKWNASLGAALVLLLLAIPAESPAIMATDFVQMRYSAPQLRSQPSGQTGPGDPAAGHDGPSGSSQLAAGEQRYDAIGYAALRPTASGSSTAIVGWHRDLPRGSFVEVTALDTGRTILVLIEGPAAPSGSVVVELAAAAARQLGLSEEGAAPVRVRAVQPPPPERAALQSGQAATPRADAPPVLLNALRKRLPDTSRAAAPPIPATPTARPSAPAPAPRAQGRFVVQIAALSNPGAAQALAQSIGGFVRGAGRFHRVQLGPFATRSEAEAARARAVRAGHGDARVIAAN